MTDHDRDRIGEDPLAAELRALADTVDGPPRLDRAAIVVRARRRRRRAGAAVAGALALVVGGVWATAAGISASGRPSPVAGELPTGTHPGPDSRVPSARSSPSVPRPQVPVPMSTEQMDDDIRCGRPLPGTVVGPSYQGVTVAVDSVVRSPSTLDPAASPLAPPLVTYRIEVAGGHTSLSPTQVMPMVVLLRDGVVVGGPASADFSFSRWDPSDQGRILIAGDIYRQWPIVSTRRAKWWLCGLTSWTDVWAEPHRYEIGVVMTPLQPWSDPFPEGITLLAAIVPLTAATEATGPATER